jgi:hypothetical protein
MLLLYFGQDNREDAGECDCQMIPFPLVQTPSLLYSLVLTSGYSQNFCEPFASVFWSAAMSIVDGRRCCQLMVGVVVVALHLYQHSFASHLAAVVGGIECHHGDSIAPTAKCLVACSLHPIPKTFVGWVTIRYR